MDEEPSPDATITLRSLPAWSVRSSENPFVHILLPAEDNGSAGRIVLDILPATVGRAAPATLILEGGAVSRRHCILEAEGDTLVISDLGSTNGTFVDGVRIDGRVVLSDGATIGIGVHRLRYQRRDKAEAAEAEAIDRDLREASSYVASILPSPIADGPVVVEWFYQPTARLGGDAFGYQMLDERYFAIFLLDVAGHGAGAALHAVSVANVLRQRMLPGVDFRDPAAVIERLNDVFPMERHNELFFTIWYGVYDTVERAMTFAAGGHHAGYLVPPTPDRPLALSTRNPAVGMMAGRSVASARIDVPPGSALSLFTDGVFEIVDRDGQQWGLDHVLPLLPMAVGSDGPRAFFEHVRAAARPGPMDDDFSVLTARFP